MHIGCLGWVSAQTESQDDQCDGCDLNERNTEFGTESLIYEITIDCHTSVVNYLQGKVGIVKFHS